jgi:hypothetical protein
MTFQIADALRAKVFEDREVPGQWRVVKMDEDGGSEADEIFIGFDAREQAIAYARERFEDYDEVMLERSAR